MYKFRIKGLCFLAIFFLQVTTGCVRRVPSPIGGAQTTPRSWNAQFPRPWQPGPAPSFGAYKEGPVVVNFESLSPLTLEPSGAFGVGGPVPPGIVVFRDQRPALVRNPDVNAQPFYKRADGAISAVAWVDQDFGDVRVSVRVNTSGGPDRRGAASRQGPLMRWDKGSNWLWCAVNYAAGTVAIVRAQHFGVMKDIDGSQRPIQGFVNTKPYDVVFDGVGQNLRCVVFDGRRLAADTGIVTDTAPLIRGISGVLMEISLERSFDPLEGSFQQLSAVELRRP